MTAPATTSDRSEVEEKVRLLVAEAVGRPPTAVTLDASLVEDLGADSLALLDLVFMLERAFGIQITRGEIEQTARGDLTDEEFAPGGVISDIGLARLRALMPEAEGRIQPGLRQGQILALFSARTFASIVLAKQPSGAPPT
jgi:acyl carrier protein